MTRPPLPLRPPLPPRVPFPAADPKETSRDRWFPASGFEEIKGPDPDRLPPAERDALLSRAVTVTNEAVAARKKGRRAEAAGLHVLAAELRREAGAWAACIENYAPLCRHHLDEGDRATADAYVQKLVFVSNFLGDEAPDGKHIAGAMSVLVALGKLWAAAAIAPLAGEHAKRHEDPCVCGIAGDPAAYAGDGRPKRGKGNPRRDDRALAGRPDSPALNEFRFRAVPVETSAARPAGSPWWSEARPGVEMLVEPPGAGGEGRYWVAHRVSNGIHQAVALPNWSCRAMQAARTMVAVSKADPQGTDGPSAAVLQVCCALEAFINAAIHSIFNSEREKWRLVKLPDYCTDPGVHQGELKPPLEKWGQLPNAIFGAGWIEQQTWFQLTLLFDLRNHLVHFRGDKEEDIFGSGAKLRLVGHLGNHAKMRPAPGHWVDRVLTPELARWAVDLGDKVILAFRTAWAAEGFKFEVIQRGQNDRSDIAAAAEADRLQEMEGRKAASQEYDASQGRPRPRHGLPVTAPSGLRRIAAKSPHAEDGDFIDDGLGNPAMSGHDTGSVPAD
ncbi:hypothetical protein QO001_001426 [Methylobacterium brachiatum]|uniref:Uncharacterized protein n=1 Tax=Methylobacterium brachiatum TaxID=269660 RepID=A0AAJ1TTZ7_9HYPH|nr:hypothetical protein [Methylobacterium brachiatum]MCB4802166.1 hypothetical protein [Methylobacterium brachiatum]MDQ0542508.1 hypothetical protein [Methylobacterium brachiatum]